MNYVSYGKFESHLWRGKKYSCANEKYFKFDWFHPMQTKFVVSKILPVIITKLKSLNNKLKKNGFIKNLSSNLT